MKTNTNLIAILFFMSILLSCRNSSDKIVEDFISYSNNYDKENCSKIISPAFIFYGRYDTLNFQEFINEIDTLKKIENTNFVNSLQNFDSIVITEERIIDFYDSLLQVEPKYKQRRVYKIKEGKIESILEDSVLNLSEYKSAYKDKFGAFLYYIDNQYRQEDPRVINSNIKKYLTEFYNLPASEKESIFKYSRLKGTYVSYDNKFYKKLIFKGKTTVVIVDAIFGFSFPTSYVLDENFIRIRTDQSDLLLEIKDNKTLIGEGFASGQFTKID